MTDTKKLIPSEVCNKIKVNENSRKAIEYKYKGKSYTLSTWKNKLKKDGFSL